MKLLQVSKTKFAENFNKHIIKNFIINFKNVFMFYFKHLNRKQEEKKVKVQKIFVNSEVFSISPCLVLLEIATFLKTYFIYV